jgi:hypothetical protein
MKRKTLRLVKLKESATEIPQGTECEIEFKTNPSGFAFMRVSPVGFPVFNTRSFTLFFEAPSERTLGNWVTSGIARTVTGDKTEPDGYGPDGAPSWLLALNLI